MVHLCLEGIRKLSHWLKIFRPRSKRANPLVFLQSYGVYNNLYQPGVFFSGWSDIALSVFFLLSLTLWQPFFVVSNAFCARLEFCTRLYSVPLNLNFAIYGSPCVHFFAMYLLIVQSNSWHILTPPESYLEHQNTNGNIYFYHGTCV